MGTDTHTHTQTNNRERHRERETEKEWEEDEIDLRIINKTKMTIAILITNHHKRTLLTNHVQY